MTSEDEAAAGRRQHHRDAAPRTPGPIALIGGRPSPHRPRAVNDDRSHRRRSYSERCAELMRETAVR